MSAACCKPFQVLDNQKDEAIERTFKQVSKYFTEVFAELVPGGRAHLIMQKRAESGAQEDAEDTGDESEGDINTLVLILYCSYCLPAC